MDLLAEELCWWPNAHLKDGKAGGVCMYAHITFGLLGLRVQLNPCDNSTFNEFSHTHRHDVPQVTVQLHYAEEFSGMGRFRVVDDAVQLPCGVCDLPDQLALWGCYCKLSHANLHLVALGIKCAK